jgi:hypothetical protein
MVILSGHTIRNNSTIPRFLLEPSSVSLFSEAAIRSCFLSPPPPPPAAPQLLFLLCSWQDMERLSKRLPSRHPQDEDNDECYNNLKKPAKKSRSRCSVHDYETNISGCVINKSSTLPLDAYTVVMEFLHPRVSDYFPFLYLYSIEKIIISN